MFCTKCGNEIHEGNLFCTKCGEKIAEWQQEALFDRENDLRQSSEEKEDGMVEHQEKEKKHEGEAAEDSSTARIEPVNLFDYGRSNAGDYIDNENAELQDEGVLSLEDLERELFSEADAGGYSRDTVPSKGETRIYEKFYTKKIEDDGERFSGFSEEEISEKLDIDEEGWLLGSKERKDDDARLLQRHTIAYTPIKEEFNFGQLTGLKDREFDDTAEKDSDVNPEHADDVCTVDVCAVDESGEDVETEMKPVSDADISPEVETATNEEGQIRKTISDADSDMAPAQQFEPEPETETESELEHVATQDDTEKNNNTEGIKEGSETLLNSETANDDTANDNTAETLDGTYNTKIENSEAEGKTNAYSEEKSSEEKSTAVAETKEASTSNDTDNTATMSTEENQQSEEKETSKYAENIAQNDAEMETSEDAEEETKERKKGSFSMALLKTIMVLLIILIIFQVALIGLCYFAPETKLGQKAVNLTNTVVHWASGLFSAAPQNGGTGANDNQLASIVDSTSGQFKDIEEISFDKDLIYPDGKSSSNEAVNGSQRLNSTVFYNDSTGRNVTYQEAIITAVESHFNNWHTKNTNTNFTGIKKLILGEIRVKDDVFYSLCRVTYKKSDETTLEKCYTVTSKAVGQQIEIETIKEENI